jgi:hypothetical protein
MHIPRSSCNPVMSGRHARRRVAADTKEILELFAPRPPSLAGNLSRNVLCLWRFK